MAILVEAGKIMEFTLKGGNLLGGQVVNVFHYFPVFTGDPTLEQYGAGLFALVIQPLLGVTDSNVNYTQIDVSQLDDAGIPFIGEPYIIPAGSGTGGISDEEALPSFNCWTFKYINAVARQRHGFKRFAGVTEGNQIDGQPTAGALSDLVAISLLLGGVLTAFTIVAGLPDSPLDGQAATPVILHRMKNGDVLNPVSTSPIAGVIFDKIGSQNTRKAGRGS